MFQVRRPGGGDHAEPGALACSRQPWLAAEASCLASTPVMSWRNIAGVEVLDVGTVHTEDGT